MAKGTSFYHVFISRYSSQEYKLLFCISIIYALACTTQIALPIIFKDAELVCSNNNTTTLCYEYEVCDTNETYFIDKKTGPKSLATQFELICERKSEKRKALSIIFMVSLFGVLFNLLTVLKPLWRKNFYSFCGIILGASLLFSVYFSQNLLVISFFLGLASLGYIMILTYSFLLINDYFEDETAKVSFGVLNICWGIMGVSFSCVAMFTNADWKILNIIIGIPIIFASIILNLLDEEVNSDLIVMDSADIHLEKESNWNLMKEAWKNKKIRMNFIVFLVYWFAQVITYIGLPIELESVGGNLYINLAIFALIELVGSFLASELSLKYEFLKTFKFFINLTVLFFVFFFFVPSNLHLLDSYIIAFFIADTFLVKLAYDTTWHLIGMYLPNLFTPRYYAQYLIVAVTISRFSLIFLPYLNYFPKYFGFHPFSLYGVLWLVSRALIGQAELLISEKKKVNELMTNSGFEIRSGVVAESQKLFDYNINSSDRLLIKRENKLRRYVEMKEILLCPVISELEEPNNEIAENIDKVLGEGRRTLIFTDIVLPKEVLEAEEEIRGCEEEQMQEVHLGQETPVIVRKNVELKRKISGLGIWEILKNENRINEEKKNLYGDESPLIKKSIKDIIHEEKEENGIK